MMPANLFVTTSDRAVENHTFVKPNTQDIRRKQLAFARDDEVLPQLFVQKNPR